MQMTSYVCYVMLCGQAPAYNAFLTAVLFVFHVQNISPCMQKRHAKALQVQICIKRGGGGGWNSNYSVIIIRFKIS